MIPAVGQMVRIRSRRHVVERVEVSPHPDDRTLVCLSCLDDDNQGAPLEVLWESEADARVETEESWTAVAERGFDDPARFAAWLHTHRWSCVTSTDARLFQAPLRAGIEVQAYQMEPLRKALAMPRINLFIADDVGLGKTIEAGLVLRELLIRQKVRRVVVACPASVTEQWRQELEERFGLSFVVYDRRFVDRQRRERGYSVNPWATHSRFIISHSRLRDEENAALLRDWLDEFAPGSLLILDEAHNAAPASDSVYAVDSHLTRTIRELTPLFEHRLFLSATPHNGHSNSFSALLELLDPQRFCRGVPVQRNSKELQAVMVRRLKKDLRNHVGGFPDRQVVQLDIAGLPDDAPELALTRLMSDYADLRRRLVADATRQAQAASAIVTTGLQKRLLSSIEAFARTLAVHRETTLRAWAKAGPLIQPRLPALETALEAPGADDDSATLTEEERAAEADAAMDTATRASAVPPSARDETLELLDQMAAIAERARHRPDSRLHTLVDWLRANLCQGLGAHGASATRGAAWGPRRILVFTEYDATKTWLVRQLQHVIAGTDQADRRIATFTGGMGDDRRAEVKDAFNADPAVHPLRILIATDAAREGVNLQNHCADLFHWDVPWNPSRLEQRNGRIDRKLQREPVVRCHYFFHTQRPEDMVLKALLEKTEQISKELGSLSTVLDQRLGLLLRNGMLRPEVGSLVRAIGTLDADTAARAVSDAELETARAPRDALGRSLDELRTLLDKSKVHLGYREEHLRGALDEALGILGAPPLAEHRLGARTLWTVPALDHGADPSWATTLDALRPPRDAGQTLWEWRRAAPLRPVTFTDPGFIDTGVVHLHLEHALVKRLLGRFTAQGFIQHDLTRATVLRVDAGVPRIVLLGKLALYGRGATRLHEEIVAVAARWVEPGLRSPGLVPYGESAERDALRAMEDALRAPEGVSPDTRALLAPHAARDVAELLPHLQAAAESAIARAAGLLAQRGEAEARAMEEILRAQVGRIEARIADVSRQPELVGLKTEREQRQIESERRAWPKRLASLAKELVEEPQRIRGVYDVTVRRVAPLGVAWLWPRSG